MTASQKQRLSTTPRTITDKLVIYWTQNVVIMNSPHRSRPKRAPRQKANHDFAQTSEVDHNRRANMKVRGEHVGVPLIATCPRTATSSQPPAWLRRTFMLMLSASMTSPSRFPAACHQKSSFGLHGILPTCGGCTSRRWRHVCSPQRSL